MVNEKIKGKRIGLKIRVLDGTGTPLRDALVEIWQADAGGFYNSPAELRGAADPDFFGWGRCPSDMERAVQFPADRRPRAVHRRALMAPHQLWIVARTSIGLHAAYFSDEAGPMPRIRCWPAQGGNWTLIAEQGDTIFSMSISRGEETVIDSDRDCRMTWERRISTIRCVAFSV